MKFWPQKSFLTGYACKGSQPTGAIGDLYSDLVNATDEATNISTKSVVSKVLMNTVKRDVSAVETAHELSSCPLYRSSHTFQSVPMTGARVLEKMAQQLQSIYHVIMMTKFHYMGIYVERERYRLFLALSHSLLGLFMKYTAVPNFSSIGQAGVMSVTLKMKRLHWWIAFPNFFKVINVQISLKQKLRDQRLKKIERIKLNLLMMTLT